MSDIKIGAKPSSEPLFPGITVQLAGEDGNAFAILGRVMKAMKRGGCTKEEIDAFREEATAGDYNHLLRTAMKYVDTE